MRNRRKWSVDQYQAWSHQGRTASKLQAVSGEGVVSNREEEAEVFILLCPSVAKGSLGSAQAPGSQGLLHTQTNGGPELQAVL